MGISDLANSDFTGRGTWSLVSQPAGANAGVGATVYIYVSIRANVTNMTVPGDYVFQVNITNPGHPDLTAQIICTVNNATSAPIISSITASPPSLTLPTSVTQLSAMTSGSTNQPLRHWWAVTTTPAGAHPLFNHQGTTNTSVSNLVLPGSLSEHIYSCVLSMTFMRRPKTETITVSPAPGSPGHHQRRHRFRDQVSLPYVLLATAGNSPTRFQCERFCRPELTFSNEVISGQPSIVGSYNIQLLAPANARRRPDQHKSRMTAVRAAVAGLPAR